MNERETRKISELKRISKLPEAGNICCGSCYDCPCADVVESVLDILQITPQQALDGQIPSNMPHIMRTSAERAWQMHRYGGELASEPEDGCGHTQIIFNRKANKGFFSNNDDDL